MKLSWQPTKRGELQLREGVWSYWHAWIAKEAVIQYRGKGRQPTEWKWYVWLASLPGPKVPHVASFKSKRQAMKFAEAAVRIG